MKLTDINRKFIVESSRSIIENSLPIKPVVTDKPIMAVEKWHLDNQEMLSKRFFFENLPDRNRFITSLMNYELEAGHHAKIIVSNKDVVVKLKTHDVNKVTELDKEYSKYADVIRRDIAYNPEK
jgi:pterin-4a-carbinolamine dehydratase